MRIRKLLLIPLICAPLSGCGADDIEPAVVKISWLPYYNVYESQKNAELFSSIFEEIGESRFQFAPAKSAEEIDLYLATLPDIYYEHPSWRPLSNEMKKYVEDRAYPTVLKTVDAQQATDFLPLAFIGGSVLVGHPDKQEEIEGQSISTLSRMCSEADYHPGIDWESLCCYVFSEAILGEKQMQLISEDLSHVLDPDILTRLERLYDAFHPFHPWYESTFSKLAIEPNGVCDLAIAQAIGNYLEMFYYAGITSENAPIGKLPNLDEGEDSAPTQFVMNLMGCAVSQESALSQKQSEALLKTISSEKALKALAQKQDCYIPIDKNLRNEPLNRTMKWVGPDADFFVPLSYFKNLEDMSFFADAISAAIRCASKEDMPDKLREMLNLN